MSTQASVLQQVAYDVTTPRFNERRRLGHSIWLLLLLREWARTPDNFVRSGESVRAAELAEALGVGDRQARRDLKRLRRAGYIELQNTGRGFRIRLVQGRAGA